MVSSVAALLVRVINSSAASAGPCPDEHSFLSPDQASGSAADSSAYADPLRRLRFSSLRISLNGGLNARAHHSNARCQQQRTQSQTLQLTHKSKPPAGKYTIKFKFRIGIIEFPIHIRWLPFTLAIFAIQREQRIHSSTGLGFDSKRDDLE